VVAATVAGESAETFPRAANQKVVNLRMRRARRPRSRGDERSPSGQEDPQQWSPGVEIAPEKNRQSWIKTRDDLADPSILTIRTVTQVRAVYGQDVDGAPLGFERGDDEGPLHLLSREASE